MVRQMSVLIGCGLKSVMPRRLMFQVGILFPKTMQTMTRNMGHILQGALKPETFSATTLVPLLSAARGRVAHCNGKFLPDGASNPNQGVLQTIMPLLIHHGRSHFRCQLMALFP